MNAVANKVDRNGVGYIDWKEFLAALRPDWEERPTTEDEIIHDEVKRQMHMPQPVQSSPSWRRAISGKFSLLVSF